MHGLVNDSVFVGWITIDSAVMMVSNPSLLSRLEHVEKLYLNVKHTLLYCLLRIIIKRIQADTGIV